VKYYALKCDILYREEIAKAICDNLSGDLTESGKPKFPTLSKTFTDVFLRKNGYTTIYKNGSSAKHFQIAIEWRFSGLDRVWRERSSAKARKAKP